MEKTMNFGPSRNLFGVITVPEKAGYEGGGGVVILNAGVIHQVGPYRLHTELARILADLGFPVLRFDLSGIGDSQRVETGMTEEELTIHEGQAAMDVLTQYCGCRSFILMGLCSGADNSHAIAVRDPRVRGLVYIDGFAYRTVLFYCKEIYRALIAPRKLLKYAVRMYRKAVRRYSQRAQTGVGPQTRQQIYEREFPPQKKVMRELRAIFDRGVKALFIYSGGIPLYFNHQRQFYDMFRPISTSGNVWFRYFKDADHIFTDYSLRAALCSEIASWLKDRFCTVPTDRSFHQSSR
jgi:pimeloyl-ACP methyl ester carboxylesterase